MNTKKERIDKLIAYYTDGNKAAFGRILGISGAAIAKWVNTGDFNMERILATFPDVNAHWLRTGEGEMILPAAKAGITQSIGNGNSNAYNIANTNAEQLAQLKAENAALKEEIQWLRYVVEKHIRKA